MTEKTFRHPYRELQDPNEGRYAVLKRSIEEEEKYPIRLPEGLKKGMLIEDFLKAIRRYGMQRIALYSLEYQVLKFKAGNESFATYTQPDGIEGSQDTPRSIHLTLDEGRVMLF